MVDETLLTRAADIVCAHVSNNAVSVDELPAMIRAVYSSFAQLGAPTEVIAHKREPAVSVRTSVKPGAIACLECGAKMIMLKRHLKAGHGISVGEYRKRWNLTGNYPMVAPEYSAKRQELTKKIGLGRKTGSDVARDKTPAGEP